MLREKNRERLARRHRRKEQRAARSPAGGLVAEIRAWNHRRLARRREPRELLRSIAANDTAVLGALVHIIQTGQEDRLAQREAQQALLARIEALERASEEKRIEALKRAEGKATETLRPALLDPEIDLLVHLAPHLPVRTALDVGANVGVVSAALLDQGMQVHAFEPGAAAYRELTRRLQGRPGFHPHPVAVGRADGEMDLHLVTDRSDGQYGDASLYSSLVEHAMPSDLPFTSTVRVPVRSLESLHQSGEIPEAVGLVKIDTEGYDLEVIRGMAARRYPLVVAEFWDHQMEFGRSGAQNQVDDMVLEMRRRDYAWHLVLFRVWGSDDVAYYCNRSESVERSWGNVLFFQERRLFSLARRWCAETLPPARFSAVRPTGSRPVSGGPAGGKMA
ncbi:MAG TPA: FkbM family methyltransferase [Anaeromyxobacteraceae bacterium]|nr:FkbM family methyltransferase [Anaeromyxobacteraceae bacterium]